MIDITTLQDFVIKALWALPLVTGLVEVIKKATNIGQRWIPILSVAIGAGVGLLIVQVSVIGAVVGIVLGLGATGLWELGKTTIAGKTSSNSETTQETPTT